MSDRPMNHASGNHAGFTLIELLVVMVVVAILASVAYPSYRDFVVRSKRTEGKVGLLEASQSLERYFTNHNTYPASLAAGKIRAHSSDNASKAAYTIAIAAGSSGSLASSFTLTATPANGHSDSKCGNLTLDSLGIKGVSGGSLSAAECW